MDRTCKNALVIDLPRYGASEIVILLLWIEAETLRCKLQPNRYRCRYGCYWQPIGTYQRPIQRYHRRPPTTYRLATAHNVTDDRRTDDRTYE